MASLGMIPSTEKDPVKVATAIRQATEKLNGLTDTVVIGPASSTDNAVARYDSTTGKLIQNSAFLVDDSGQVSSFGGNIKFPATQAASADANTLDDYEEGTWTPTINYSTTPANSITYATQSGWYTKIGNLVTIGFAVQTSGFTLGSGAGNFQVRGMPFACGVAHTYGACAFQGITKTNYTQFALQGQQSQTFMLIRASASAQSASTVTEADTPTGGTLLVTGTMSYPI